MDVLQSNRWESIFMYVYGPIHKGPHFRVHLVKPLDQLNQSDNPDGKLGLVSELLTINHV